LFICTLWQGRCHEFKGGGGRVNTVKTLKRLGVHDPPPAAMVAAPLLGGSCKCCLLVGNLICYTKESFNDACHI